jgi:hypothetical protein
LGEDFPLGTKGGVAARHYFPVDGEYVFRLRLQRAWETSIRGLNVKNQFEIRVDGVKVAQFTLGGEKSPSRTFVYDGDEALQARVPVKAGLHQVMATMLKSDNAGAGGRGPDRLSPTAVRVTTQARPSLHRRCRRSVCGKVPVDSPSR